MIIKTLKKNLKVKKGQLMFKGKGQGFCFSLRGTSDS